MFFLRNWCCVAPILACLSTRSATGDLLRRRGRAAAASTAGLRRVSLLGPESAVKSIRCSGSDGIFLANNCGGFIGASLIVGPLRLRLLPSGSFGTGRLLSSAEGLVCSVVVPLEVVGGAGSLLPRAPVSGVKEIGGPLATCFPVIIMYTSRAAFSELTPGFCLMYVSISP